MFDTVLQQPVTPVFTSEYARKVLDFLDASITRDGERWTVRDGGQLRTVRLPPGRVPDLTNATGVAGYLPGPGGTYVHLTGGEASFAVIDQSKAPRMPYLADANGVIDNFTRTPSGFSFDLRARVAPQFRLANTGACRVTRHTSLHRRSPIACRCRLRRLSGSGCSRRPSSSFSAHWWR